MPTSGVTDIHTLQERVDLLKRYFIDLHPAGELFVNEDGRITLISGVIDGTVVSSMNISNLNREEGLFLSDVGKADAKKFVNISKKLLKSGYALPHFLVTDNSGFMVIPTELVHLNDPEGYKYCQWLAGIDAAKKISIYNLPDLLIKNSIDINLPIGELSNLNDTNTLAGKIYAGLTRYSMLLSKEIDIQAAVGKTLEYIEFYKIYYMVDPRDGLNIYLRTILSKLT